MTTRLYKIWASMKQRCSNPNSSNAKYYYSKGIRVCEEWEDFEKFEKWAIENGYADDLTIDRIDNSKGYFPDNCQWISKSENSRKAGKESNGIWQVRAISESEARHFYYQPYIYKEFAQVVADNLSYSKALKISERLSKENKGFSYRVINIYGEFRKLK